MCRTYLSLMHCFSNCAPWTLSGLGPPNVKKNLPSDRGKGDEIIPSLAFFVFEM